MGEDLILVSLREVVIGAWYALSYPIFMLFSKFLMLVWWSRSISMAGGERIYGASSCMLV
jgi:hypothetical protein